MACSVILFKEFKWKPCFFSGEYANGLICFSSFVLNVIYFTLHLEKKAKGFFSYLLEIHFN